ncbi:MAG TPA: hypothetical protein VFW04_15655 [Gemmatimonadaceae bacterium]|nr:hypothetical protein [Gemmatimonadaceae bacterium]
MSFDYRVVPLPATWPGKATPAYARRRAPFKGTPGKALKLLAREIGMLNGKHVRIAIDVREDQIRLDGQLYASARARTPGVIVSFEVSDGTLQFPCDTFLFWESNVDAIARALEALRMVDRYGVQQGKQYTGFKAIPATTAPVQSAEQAAVNIASLVAPIDENVTATVRRILSDREFAGASWRKARAKAHPDAGGNDGLFVAVQRDAQILAAHHGVASL